MTGVPTNRINKIFSLCGFVKEIFFLEIPSRSSPPFARHESMASGLVI